MLEVGKHDSNDAVGSSLKQKVDQCIVPSRVVLVEVAKKLCQNPRWQNMKVVASQMLSFSVKFHN